MVQVGSAVGRQVMVSKALLVYCFTINLQNGLTPAQEAVSQLIRRRSLRFCHPGFDPKFSVFLMSQVAGCRICHPGLDPGPA